MDDVPLSSLYDLIEEAKGSLDDVLRLRVTIASNSIEIYSLFEHIRTVLIQTSNDDPNFIDILKNGDSEEKSSNPIMESLLQEINELIIKFNEFFKN